MAVFIILAKCFPNVNFSLINTDLLTVNVRDIFLFKFLDKKVVFIVFPSIRMRTHRNWKSSNESLKYNS